MKVLEIMLPQRVPSVVSAYHRVPASHFADAIAATATGHSVSDNNLSPCLHDAGANNPAVFAEAAHPSAQIVSAVWINL